MQTGSFLYILAPIILQTFVPSQVHVSLSDLPNEFVFSWATPLPTRSSYVRLTQESIWVYFEGASSVFIDQSTKWYFHTVRAVLDPGSVYTYQVGCQSEGFSEDFLLRTPPETGKVRTLVLGDFSVKDLGKATWETIKTYHETWGISSLIMLGDLAYDLHSELSSKGDEFMDEIQSVVSKIPLMVCAGNHEKFDKYHNYLSRFAMPGNQFFFTYTLGHARFVVLHTEALVYGNEDLEGMLSFLKKALNRSKKDKEKHPWLIVYGHRPLYCLSLIKGGACGREASILKRQVEDLFFLNDVDLYLSGHVHNYQRTHPVFKDLVTTKWDDKVKGYINPKSTIYVVTGAAGSDQSNTQVKNDQGIEYMASWSSRVSFGKLSVENKTHLLWSQVDSESREDIDSFWVVKRSNKRS